MHFWFLHEGTLKAGILRQLAWVKGIEREAYYHSKNYIRDYFTLQNIHAPHVGKL